MQTVSSIPKIGKDLGLEFYMLNLHRHLFKTLNDIIYAVRNEVIKSISLLVDIFSKK